MNLNGFFELYERWFFAPFVYINEVSKKNNEVALITVSGLGCGQFAGKLKGVFGSCLRDVLVSFVKKYSDLFSLITVVYFDFYSECYNERIEIDYVTGISIHTY